MKRTGSSTALAGLLALFLITACSPGPPPEQGPSPEEGRGEGPVAEAPGPQQRTGEEPSGRTPPVPDEEDLRLRAPHGVDLDTIEAGRFDQGKMWTFEYPPVDYLREEYGLEPDSAWFRDARLGALRIPSCSGSFVSPSGLLMTNHHCAREFVTQVSEDGENLLDEGFYARSLEEERPVEDFHADQLVEILDITDRVSERTVGLSGGNLVEARTNVLEDIGQEILEERGGEDEGWVVETISLYNGARFSAYVFKRYEHARLVVSPELQIGFFGGDPDNFTYPRYNLDFTFFRLVDESGEPLDSRDHYFEWSDQGVEAGDPIFIIGNPGSTSRLQTVAQLEFRRDVSDSYTLDFIENRIEVLRDFIEAYPDEAEEHDLRNTLFSLLNQQKAMTGQLEGLADPVILARRRASQEALLDSIQADPELREEFGEMVADMRELQEEKRELAPGFGAFLGLTAPGFASPTLHRALVVFQILNGQRAGASSEQLAPLLEQLREVGDIPEELDEGFVEARIREFQRHYPDAPWVEEMLEGRTPEGAAAVLVANSMLSDSAAAVQAVERGSVDREDPAIDFVIRYVPAFAEFQQGFSGLAGREQEIARAIGRARFEVFGTSQPPDATFSLRLADGVVSGYGYNGTVAPVYTTLYGLYDHYYSYLGQYEDPSESPWDLPERWLDRPEGLDLSTPLNFVSTADIIGGNSGSPVVNEFLEVVGLVFDGNIQSLPGDYIYLPEENRSVAVDARGILEALDEVYDMDRIVLELTTGRLVPSEAEADAIGR